MTTKSYWLIDPGNDQPVPSTIFIVLFAYLRICLFTWLPGHEVLDGLHGFWPKILNPFVGPTLAKFGVRVLGDRHLVPLYHVLKTRT